MTIVVNKQLYVCLTHLTLLYLDIMSHSDDIGIKQNPAAIHFPAENK